MRKKLLKLRIRITIKKRLEIDDLQVYARLFQTLVASLAFRSCRLIMVVSPKTFQCDPSYSNAG